MDRSHGICVDDPSVYVVGDTRSYAVGDEDAFILKLDVNGEDTIPEFTLQIPIILFASSTIALAIILRSGRKVKITPAVSRKMN